jgi:predicted HTH transcriptional regulator
MNLTQLEELISGGEETQKIDFKAPCKWAVKNFAKDLLAFSNVQDGGYIVIGVSETENGFIRDGLTDEIIKTFDIDIMKDQLAAYADPHIEFSVFVQSDSTDKKYVVICIKEFQELPIICAKDSEDTKRGIVYYRTSRGRPQSAPISNSYDMRNVIDRATIKNSSRFKKLGINIENDINSKYEIERGNL